MKKKIINAILFIIFIAGLFGMLYRANFVLRQKDFSGVQDMFAALEPDSVDMIFIGSSHQFCSISPEILYDEYGVNSFMLATSAQTVPMSYYAAMEAIELQHPDVIVFEASYCANDYTTVGDEMTHCFFDGMPRCQGREEGLKDLVEKEDRIFYYLNLGAYHTRWKELDEDDYSITTVTPRGGVHYPEVGYNWEIPVISPDEISPMPEAMEGYVDKMIQLCEENDVKLIFYIAPFNSMYGGEDENLELFERQRIFNYVGEYAKEHNVPFYNLYYEMDAIGLEANGDWKDSQHLNASGQAKLTRYMMDQGYLEY